MLLHSQGNKSFKGWWSHRDGRITAHLIVPGSCIKSVVAFSRYTHEIKASRILTVWCLGPGSAMCPSCTTVLYSVAKPLGSSQVECTFPVIFDGRFRQGEDQTSCAGTMVQRHGPTLHLSLASRLKIVVLVP